MYWVRSHLKLGSLLALLALVFQLAVAFGHVHLDPGSRFSAAGLAFSAALPQSDVTPASVPAGDEGPPATDHCAFCALIHLAGTLVAAKPPVLPLPAIFGHLPAPATTEFCAAASDRAPFSARAPPIA